MSAGNEGLAYIWSTEDFSRLQKLEGHEGAIYCAAVDPKGELIITGGMDQTVRIWKAENG